MAMPEKEKPFIAYRSGRWGLSIVPRNPAGWRALVVWMVPLIPITALFVWFESSDPERAIWWAGLATYLVAMIIWSLGLIRWTLARSETINMNDFLAFKREREKDKRRR